MNFNTLEEVKERINKNYACIRDLEKQIPLQKTKEKKLEVLSFIGKMYSWFVTGVYSSNVLEQQIMDLGKSLLFYPLEQPQENQILIVMSVAATVGGHTLLVHNWIRWDSKRQYSIVFTDMNESGVPAFINEAVKESGGRIYFLFGTCEEKASKLLEISQKFCRIILFTHMEDIVPVLAYSNKNWTIPVYFYNHADWRFSFGFSVSDAVLNLFPFDIDKDVRYRGIPVDNCYHLQFPGAGMMEREIEKKVASIDIQKWILEKYHISETEKLIVSMGYDYRFQNIIGYEFDSYVQDVIKESNSSCRFLIIGPDGKREKWLRLEKNTHGRARALGMLSREETECLIANADLYVISFPQSSSGRTVAEQAGVPCLWLDIIGRTENGEDIRSAKSVSELTEKTLDILNGNKEPYQASPNIWRWNQTRWIQEWERIFTNVTEHSVHDFHPQRHIEKQEYINCQLLQEEAAENIVDFLSLNSLDKSLVEKLIWLDGKYNMGISHRYIGILEGELNKLAKLSHKHLRLYKTAMEWVKIRQKRISIGEYLYNQGYRTTAIYGLGIMGEQLLEELLNGPVKVLYCIDRRAEKLQTKTKIYHPVEKRERVDVILNTTTLGNEEILNELKTMDENILQFADLLSIINDGDE